MQSADTTKREALAGVAEDTSRDAATASSRKLAPNDDAVLAALRANASHPTAGELYDAVRLRFPRVGRATVYRALQRLEAAGLAVEVGRDSLGRHYDARTERHDHAICTQCGGVHDILPKDELPPELLAGLESLAHAAGVAVESYEIRLYGRCDACREQDSAEEPAHARYTKDSSMRRGESDE